MIKEEQKMQNRKRCIACKYYGVNRCPLLADASVSEIDKCILEYDSIKSIKSGSLDEFIYYNLTTSKHYLSYLGWKDKENYPKVGETVATLRNGFGSLYSGKFLKVIEENDVQLFLCDLHSSGEERQYGVTKEDWYKSLFKIHDSPYFK